MRNIPLVSGLLFFCISISLAVSPKQAAAQGPAGMGAASAAQDGSHSYNPLSWIKKNAKNSNDAPGMTGDTEKKLTQLLQGQGVLTANVTAADACAPFAVLDECLAALHAGHNLGLDFNCLRTGVTGVLTNADLSGCKLAGSEKPQGLSKAIHELKPDTNAKQAAKDAEQQAKDDLAKIGG